MLHHLADRNSKDLQGSLCQDVNTKQNVFNIKERDLKVGVLSKKQIATKVNVFAYL